MNLTSRFSFLATLAACSIFFTVSASAQVSKTTLLWNGKTIEVPTYLVSRYVAAGAIAYTKHSEAQAGNIGTVYSKGRIQVNLTSKTASDANSGVGIEDCTIIQTFEKPATVQLGNGRYVLIKPNTIAQVCVHRAGNVVATVVGGGNGRGATVYAPNNQQNWQNTVNQWLADSGVTDTTEIPGYLAWTPFTNSPVSGGGSGNSYPNPSGINTITATGRGGPVIID